MQKNSRLTLVVPLLIGLTTATSSAHAASGADALLNSVGKTPARGKSARGAQKDRSIEMSLDESRVNDPFLVQLSTLRRHEHQLPYDVNAWIARIMRQEYREAAHLWSAIEPKVPGSFEINAQAAQAYLLWKLELPQTFFDYWVQLLSNSRFTQSRIAAVLEQVISPGFDDWLEKEAISVSPEQESVIRRINSSRGPVFATLHGWISLRKGEQALSALKALPPGNRIRIPLAQTVALGLAKKKDLSGAAKILKRHLEPAIEARNDVTALSSHYMQIARLLYQAGSLDGAEQFYLKIPSGTPEFLTAREELLWVWLRKGNADRLRGELATLSASLFEDHFSPEIHMIRAISNLKLCFYDEVEKDFSAFLKHNSRWATEITAALKSEDPSAPRNPDEYSRLAAKGVEMKLQEMDHLSSLAEESIGASLPAVGPQTHWVKSKAKLQKAIESGKKLRTAEYRRQWKSEKAAVTEAIRKMRFVKVEFLSQVRMFSGQSNAVPTDEVHSSNSAALRNAPNEIAFPFDGVIWPDELFKLRSIAQGRCLNGETK